MANMMYEMYLDSVMGQGQQSDAGILAEYTDSTIDTAGGWSSASAAYTQGAGTDQPFLRTEWSSAGAGTNPSSRQFYHQDGLGSVIASTDQSGANTASQRFDAWGNSIASSGAAISQYGYTGREPDATGLMYYRARYYSPDLGRFTQRDPIGLAGGVNMFGYVGGNPVNGTDPSGLDTYVANRDLAAFGTSARSLSNPITHTFTFSTNPDGSIAATYSWGNAANLNGWNLNQPEDMAAAAEALKNGLAMTVAPAYMDVYYRKAFDQLNVSTNDHSNLILTNNCKVETVNLNNLASKLAGWK
jgi:RHS repeat-associated protein